MIIHEKGFIHYISCFFCLAVIPTVMKTAGYEPGPMFLTTAITSGLASIIGGVVVNLPFPFAPPTVIAIFLSSYLKNYASVSDSKLSTPAIGCVAVIISGLLISILGYRPLSNFIGRLIPSSIQVGTSVGIGLLTALAGMYINKLLFLKNTPLSLSFFLLSFLFQ